MPVIPGSRWFGNDQNIQAVRNAFHLQGANASLIHGKYIQWSDTEAFKFDKKDHMDVVVRIRPPINNAVYQILKRRKNQFAPPVQVFSMSTQSRVAINMGNESILETSIALHPLHGFPFLSGSAIKGVTRHYVKDNGLLGQPDIVRFFGHEPGAVGGPGALAQGDLIFGDAWPQAIGAHLELDLMNPHYGRYYRDGRWPADNQDPVPVTFLAIKKGVAFEFVLALSLKGRLAASTAASTVLDQMEQLVREALRTYGIGAKTGAGYGYFI